MTLKTRITISFVLLMAAVMLLVASVAHLAYVAMEQYIFGESMRNEAQWLALALQQGYALEVPPGRQLYDALSVPQALRNYPLGVHELDQPEPWHLLVFESNDQRYYLLQDSTYFEHLEPMVDAFMLLIVVLCIVSAFWIGRLTSARVIAPIKQLADAVEHQAQPLPFEQASDEMGQLARAFAAHKHTLEQFLQREQAFASDASHELRTPLAIIGGAAETIAHQLPTDSRLLGSAERIVRTTEEMQRQLSCLLLLSRAPETIAHTKVSLRPLVEECVTRARPWLGQKPVALHLDAPEEVTLHTNAELARSVIWNLLRNACQYTQQGQVRISLSASRLAIADTGPGLPPELNPHGAERFAPSVSQGGEGLGLSIVLRIAEHLGWQMQVDSSEHGCCFTLLMGHSSPALANTDAK
ncbi:HAMP domain-containing histidine kinase [Lampropedia aestuarii]|uniref:histidine kinase n=1 Tax=Lampropedia aestuarii TaxID=2562762 RepID=A0A4S5BU57_9BURK|nr:HAMP domain-containing sensor histidine kinase [Lampropedia aestuarii]THJ34535.1 HAMP domain-containing histidine kinase [Lampropedia aestuarii]